MQTLISVPGSSGQTLDVGISPALQDATGFLWADGSNVVFREGGPRSMRGWTSLVTLGEQAWALEQYYNEDTSEGRIYAATPESLYLWEPSIGKKLLASGYTHWNWSLAPRGTQLLATNGREPLQYWAGTIGTAPVAVTTQFDTCEIIRIFKQFAVAFNTSGSNAFNGKAAIEWSNDDDVTTWSDTDNFYLRDMQGEIRAAEPLGDDMALYARDSMWLMRYIGGDIIFSFRKLSDTIGAYGKNAICSVGTSAGPQHFGWGPQGIWATDGVTTANVDNPAIREYLIADLDTDHAHKIVAFHDEQEQQVVFYYRDVNAAELVGIEPQNSKGVGYNYSNGAWTLYNFGRSAALEKAVFAYPITADRTEVYAQGTDTTANGTNLSSWVQSAPLDMGNPEIRKRIQGVRLALEASGGTTQLYVGAQEDYDDAIEWFYIEDAEVLNHIPDRETALVRIQIVGNGSAWHLAGFSVLGQLGGYTP